MTLDFRSTITGSFATPCAENPTVAMVEAAYTHHGIDARYLNCDVQPEHLRDDPAGAHVVVFGAGGAARAVAVETALAGAARITVVNRSAGRGADLAALVADRTPAASALVGWDSTYRVPDDATIVVNTTSIGLSQDVEGRLDVDLDSLRPGLVVADVIPNPPRTLLVRSAEERGCTVLDGLGMLVNQGVISIKHWTGVDVDPVVMRARIGEIFGS